MEGEGQGWFGQVGCRVSAVLIAGNCPKLLKPGRSVPKKAARRAERLPRGLGDIIFGGVTRLAAVVTLLLLGGIIVSLLVASMPTIQKFGLSFLWRSEWDPPSETFGALVPIYGTIATSIIALIIAVPVS